MPSFVSTNARIFVALLPWLAAAQPKAEFEVASIRPSASSNTDRVNVGLRIDGAQLHCNYFSLRDYIALAYDVRDYQVSGPDWLTAQRFDVSATLPSGSKRDQVPGMFVALLAERFRMQAHRESKEFPVYALVLGKGPLKMKESEGAAGAASNGNTNVAASGGQSGVSVNLGNGSSLSFANNKFEATRVSMPSFVEGLRRFLDRPVIDQTGLTKAYDFTLSFTPEDYNAMMIRSALSAGVVLPPQALKALEYGSLDSLFSAIESLGLKLDRRRAPLDVIVVDHMEKEPTEN